MTGFELMTAEIKDFESSAIYRNKFNIFLSCISKRGKDNPAKSADIEKALDLSGPAVRSLVRYSRLKKYKIASNEHGYYMAKNAFEIKDTIKHLRERSAILAVLANCLEQPNAESIKDQTEMNL
jgi:hypothetical protein